MSEYKQVLVKTGVEVFFRIGHLWSLIRLESPGIESRTLGRTLIRGVPDEEIQVEDCIFPVLPLRGHHRHVRPLHLPQDVQDDLHLKPVRKQVREVVFSISNNKYNSF